MEEPQGTNVIKIVAIVVSVILIIVAGFAMFEYSRQTNAERAKLEAAAGPLNEKLSRLNSKKAELQVQLDEIENEMKYADDSLCSVMVLMSECKSEILQDTATLLANQNYPGIIAVSDVYAPGMSGCITWDEAKTLEDNGWELCVSCSDTTALNQIKKTFEAAGHELPKTVYYPNGVCGEETEAEFVKCGFDTIIESGGVVTALEDGKAWHVPAMGSFSDLSVTALKSSMTKSEPIVFTVGYEREDEMYGESNITNMLKQFKAYESKDALKVTTLTEARERYAQHMENVKANAASLQGEHDEIQAQIDEINAEINELRGGKS